MRREHRKIGWKIWLEMGCPSCVLESGIRRPPRRCDAESGTGYVNPACGIELAQLSRIDFGVVNVTSIGLQI